MDQQDPTEAMASEYEQVRDDFDFNFVLIGVALVLLMLYLTGVIGGEKPFNP